MRNQPLQKFILHRIAKMTGKVITVAASVIATLIARTAIAAVADQFKCQVSSVDGNGTPQLRLEFPTAAVREANLKQSGARLQVTRAQFGATFSGAGERPQNYPKGDFTYFYSHAVEYDAAGNPLRAAQALGVGFCTQLDSNNGQCADSFIPCTEAEDDPFDPQCDWTPVPLANGVPRFDDSKMEPIVYEREAGTMRIECDYVKTAS